jgi:hypothetical protein
LHRKHTVVTVLNPTDSGSPAAIVHYAGTVYAASGMNRHGLFLEYNVGNTQHYSTNHFLDPSWGRSSPLNGRRKGQNGLLCGGPQESPHRTSGLGTHPAG